MLIKRKNFEVVHLSKCVNYFHPKPRMATPAVQVMLCEGEYFLTRIQLRRVLGKENQPMKN